MAARRSSAASCAGGFCIGRIENRALVTPAPMADDQLMIAFQDGQLCVVDECGILAGDGQLQHRRERLRSGNEGNERGREHDPRKRDGLWLFNGPRTWRMSSRIGGFDRS